ncbi:MAG: rRNA maturation RNase YbeY [Bacteroidetes bacterium]|nr:rRNA maturation RNase YbeY [Bacteroidota bacterium]
MIEFEFLDIEIPGFDSEFFVLTINDLIKSEKFELGEITIVFCNDEYLLEMNNSYMDHDYYTDIITFDYSEGAIISGDLFISVHRVEDNSKTFHVSFSKELSRVIYHGVLHLCGYNDKSDEDILVMRDKENYYLGKFVSRETN